MVCQKMIYNVLNDIFMKWHSFVRTDTLIRKYCAQIRTLWINKKMVFRTHKEKEKHILLINIFHELMLHR